MLASRPIAALTLGLGLLAAGLAPGESALAQLPVNDWTERPDARAPAAMAEDGLLPPGKVEILYNLRVNTFQDLLAGTDEIPPILVLSGAEPNWPAFEMAPYSMTRGRHEVEVRVGVLSWLGASVKVPYLSTEAEFLTNQLTGSPCVCKLGDLEVHLLYGLHDVWPYRAHLSAGVAFPTGSIEERGRLPNDPGVEVILPYPLQPGDGSYVLLPSAVFVAENEFGTVGLRGNARIPVGENDRGWTRGPEVEGHVWMGYRFTPWVSGSARLTFRSTGNLSGFDPEIYRWSTPMANPDLQGGTRVELPIGMNVLFVEGPLRGNQLRAEFILPVHQSLDGPQLKSRYGVALSWGVTFF